MADRKWNPREDQAEEEDEEEDGLQYQSQKDAILFAIHVSPSMLEVHEDDDDEAAGESKKKKKSKPISAAKTALQTAYQILQARIISNPNDMMGILLFGTEKTKFGEENDSNSGFMHIYTLMDLDVPSAEDIKNLRDLLKEDDKDAEEKLVELLQPTSSTVSLANVLFAANQIFTTKAANFQSRRLFLITDNDDPHATDKALRNSAITRARDLYDLGVTIDPFYISYSGRKPFDASKFYDDIVYRSPYEGDEEAAPVVSGDGTTRLREMVSSIYSRSASKRANFSVPLELGPGLTIGVKGYTLIKRQENPRSHFVYTGSEVAKLATSATTKIAEETAKIVDAAEIKRAFPFGGEQIVFSPDELKAMRQFGDPVVRIIGFKPQASIVFAHNLRPAQFLYPDEGDFVGSTRVFAALHKTLVARTRVGIAWCIPRKGATPFLGALWPSVEERDEAAGSVQRVPAGFFLIQLPFADDIRQHPDVHTVKAPAELIDGMRAVVKQLHMPKGYVPEKYANPALQWHYRTLQAMALDEDMPEHPVDATIPKFRLIEKHVGPLVQEWGKVLDGVAGGLQEASVPAAAKRKRAPPKEDAEPALKKPKKEAGAVDLREAYEKGTLAKLTIAQLKEAIAGIPGLQAKGRKQDLIDAVEEHFDSK